MMELAVTPKTMKALCKAVDATCKPLLKHSSATAAHVSATSIQLSSIFSKHWVRECSKKDLLTSYQLLANSSFPSNLLNFLLWSLPHLSSSLLEASGHVATHSAWAYAESLLQSVVCAGASLDEVQSSRAAAVKLLEQLQPASDLSKPGKHQKR
jgi:hypothetical protein